MSSDKISGKRILLMDDDLMVLDIASRMLDHLGYYTSTAKDGDGAVKLYKQEFKSEHPFDLVILDLTVPCGIGGAKTIPELIKIDPKVKAIVSSGYSNDPVMANYEDYGFCGVVQKPYTKGELSEILNKVFEER